MASIPAEEKKWQAESDVRTLTEADMIAKTPARLRAAKTAAKRMVREEKKTLAAMDKVAKVNKPAKPAKKTPVKKK